MLATYPYHGHTFSFNPSAPLDISLPLAPGSNQVNCFWAEPVQFDTIRVGDFVGSVAEGGSTNYKRVHLTPHGNGTHTECYGHISTDPEATINRCLRRFLFVARLISVEPRQQANGDQIVMLADAQSALGAFFQTLRYCRKRLFCGRCPTIKLSATANILAPTLHT
ncbi:cyclase family protein [Hymenobacter radiodurans]|uniref:cyclase family protein n=1 Tax=Hymenobacter radiodurans TaxID=2496028 RepID=UPI001F107309|nr:cyclase family protein [Hymenobacter radiodurans]